MGSRSEFYREVYYPHQRYKAALEYTLEEVQDEVEQQRKLDDLILKAQSNTARLAETYRERAPSPGQAIRLTEARRLMRDYEAGLEGAAKARSGFAANPGARGKEALRVFRAETGAADRAVAAEAVKIAQREADKITDPALKRKAFVDILESSGLNYKSLAPTELDRATRAVFDEGYGSVQTKAASKEDAAARSRAAEFEAPEEPIAVMRARAEISAAESPFAHGRMVSGLTPEEEELRNLFVNRLRDEESPGTATAAEFESPEQYAKARTAYQKAREEGSYLKSDAEWFASDYLSAVQTEGELKRRRDEGLAYTDPFEEAQRRARERGGYTIEDLYELKYYGDPKAARVRPAFSRARAEGGIEPQTEMEKVVGELYEQSKAAGRPLSDDDLFTLLKEKQRGERKVGRAERRVARRTDEPIDREAVRAERGARRDFYSNDNIERAMVYLSARKITDQGLVDAPEGEIKAPVDPAIAVAEDDLAEAAITREQVLQQVREQVEEADIVPRIAPEPAAPEAAPAPEAEVEEITLRGEVAPVEDMESKAPDVFTDPNDPTLSYRKTPSGDAYMVIRNGIPTGAARKGTRAFESIASVEAGGPPLAPLPKPPAPPPAAPTAPVEAPTSRPPGAPATLGLAGATTGPFQALTPAEQERLAERQRAAAGPKAVGEMTMEELEAELKQLGGE